MKSEVSPGDTSDRARWARTGWPVAAKQEEGCGSGHGVHRTPEPLKEVEPTEAVHDPSFLDGQDPRPAEGWLVKKTGLEIQGSGPGEDLRVDGVTEACNSEGVTIQTMRQKH